MRSRDGNTDVERARSPESSGRRRTMSWYDGRQDEGRAGARESSATGRLRPGAGKVGSLEEQSNIHR